MIKLARSRFVWLAGAVLAVSAATAAYAEVDAAPQPATPTYQNSKHHVIIVEKRDDAGGSSHVRTITRDGKTFVFTTDRPLSDADVEKRIADAESRMPLMPPVPPVAGQRATKQRVLLMNDKGENVTDVVTEEGERCKGRDAVSDVASSAENDGKLTRVRIRICGAPDGMEEHAMVEALKGVRQARDEIANDKSLSESIRGQILKDLDAEIARLGS